MTDEPVVVVTGGGGGIGAGIAEELGRRGCHVVTLDPLVSLDGSERLPPTEETTAGRIVAAGGSARASSVSVTDGAAVRGLFDDLVDELGRLDAVINVAGISRPTSFAGGSDQDWRSVLEVHLDGYLNVLHAALPIMAAAGRGRILGVTSGSGWRAADAGAYSCAKRAVASLTWELGRHAPPGVVINAMSPIAVTRMVTAALGRARPARAAGSGSAATGGLSLGSMPQPEDLGPLAAHLVSEGFSWCSGTVLFAGGSEVAVIDPPRLLEVVRTDRVPSLAPHLEAASAVALGPAEAAQASAGGGNPRLATEAGEMAAHDVPPSGVRSCAIVTDRPDLSTAVTTALDARGVACHSIPMRASGSAFGDAAGALASTVERVGGVDAVVVALAGGRAAAGATEWERILAGHAGIVEQIHTDAAWARAAADHAAASDRPMRLVTVSDAVGAGGRTRAQASAQLARASRRATDERVAAFAVSLETSAATPAVGELVAHLVGSPEAAALSGAELAADDGWVGLRSHPRPGGSISLGGPELPDWFDDALRSLLG